MTRGTVHPGRCDRRRRVSARRTGGPGLAIGVLVGLCATASSAAPGSDVGNISGVWVRADTPDKAGAPGTRSAKLSLPKDSDGNAVPLTPWALAITQKHFEDSKAGHPFRSTKARCLPAGLPRSMDLPPTLAMQVLVNPDQVTILFEEFNNWRAVHMGGTHPKDMDPGYFGHSVGHWEGKVLVVDSVGFTTETTTDSLGTPHSDAMHIVERIRRTGPDTLEDAITVEDPVAFTKPWPLTIKYKKINQTPDEFFCDNDRDAVAKTPAADGASSIPK